MNCFLLFQVINVPISDEDIIRTVKTLPRNSKTNGMVEVILKRKKEYKSGKQEQQNKQQLLDGLDFLRRNHPGYSNMKIDEDFDNDVELQKEDNGNDSDCEMEDCTMSDQEDNPFLESTCLLPENPETKVIFNKSNSPMYKKVKLDSNIVHEIAPGEGKIPTNWLRDPCFDIHAFPRHHPDGKYGLNYNDRRIKLSPYNYFNQRLINVDKRFAKDPEYLFCAQQYVERYSLERQIDLSVRQKGKLVKTDAGLKVVQPNDMFNVFKKVPGTPAYWKSFRNDLYAKLEQLGPFHLFFTLSCAEMQWPEVISSILQENGHTITFDCSPWDGKMNSVKVDGIPLNEYYDRMSNKTEFFKDHVILITRMFDSRVKAFLKNIMLSSDVQHYTLRIEFQVNNADSNYHCTWSITKTFYRLEECLMFMGSFGSTSVQKKRQCISTLTSPLIYKVMSSTFSLINLLNAS